MAFLIFCLGIIWLFYVYCGYAICLWILGLFRRVHPKTDPGFSPTVSVLISARNEERDIDWKVRETLAWDYPPERLQLLVASDASEDRTDEILQNISDSRLKYVRMSTRVGKNAALNRLVKLATGDLLVFTDANSHIAADCLHKLVRHFADERVGCVTGVEENAPEDSEEMVASGGKAFLNYEELVKSLEGRLGSVLICDGAIFSLRRTLFVELLPELANDLELPLHAGAAGKWILCELAARALEKATRSAREDFARRRRIVAQGSLGMWRLRACLRGLRAWQFLSHKLLRWLTLLPLGLVLLSNLFLARSPLFAWVLGLQAVFYSAAIAGWILDRAGFRGSPPLAMPYYFLLANVAAMRGFLDGCTGRQFSTWEIASLSRGPGQAER
jgi:cellulose synthase/poly-beta-1,6-N-acetylglucosamine synthase-like glycosyltransferase